MNELAKACYRTFRCRHCGHVWAAEFWREADRRTFTPIFPDEPGGDGEHCPWPGCHSDDVYQAASPMPLNPRPFEAMRANSKGGAA